MSEVPASALASAADETGVTFRLADPDRSLAGVRLWVDVDVPMPRDLEWHAGDWELRLDDPPLDRIEYLFEVGDSLVPDPGNPLRVGGAFGDHSWLPLAGYRPPAWVDRSPVAGHHTPWLLEDTPVGELVGALWSPDDAPSDEPLPLLISHDGPEMDAYGGLTHYAGALIAEGRLPRLRVALLVPGERNPRYAANRDYAQALTDHVVPMLRERWATRRQPVLMGQSLGALAALHACWTRPRVFGGLFLQSGSFFTPETDPQESGFAHWTAVCGFVRSVLEEAAAPPGVPPVTVVCGTAEENLANNRVLAGHLAATGVEVSWGDVRDGHHWTCWRDLLDPHLTDLLARVWG